MELPSAVVLGLLAAAALAGCAGHAPTPSADTPSATLPGSAGIDLSKSVLDVAMPEGTSSMLTVLDFTEANWIHPTVGWFGGVGAITNNLVGNPAYLPMRDESIWTLCAFVEPLGLPEGSLWLAEPYWVQGGKLVAAAPPSQRFDMTSSQRVCLTDTQSPLNYGGPQADQPFSGQLAVLFAAYGAEASSQSLPLPAFDLKLGLGAYCSDDPTSQQFTRICLPEETVAVEPAVRGGPTVHVLYDETQEGMCGDCGFVRYDNTTSFPTKSGLLTIERQGTISPGMTFVFGFSNEQTIAQTFFVPSDNAVEAHLVVDGNDVTVQCGSDPYNNQWFSFLVPQATPAWFQAKFDMNGVRQPYVSIVELPMDWSRTGLTIEPVATINSMNTVPATEACGPR